MAKFKENGKLKLLIIVGTRPEIIRLAAVINECRKYFDCLLAHTGQNYDYNLNGVFFKDLKLADPDVYMEAVGNDLGATMGNIIDKSYKLMVQTKPDAVLVLGSASSSNTARLCECAPCRAFRAGTMDEVKALDLSGVTHLGVTSGASTPEEFLKAAVSWLRGERT